MPTEKNLIGQKESWEMKRWLSKHTITYISCKVKSNVVMIHILGCLDFGTSRKLQPNSSGDYNTAGSLHGKYSRLQINLF